MGLLRAVPAGVSQQRLGDRGLDATTLPLPLGPPIFLPTRKALALAKLDQHKGDLLPPVFGAVRPTQRLVSGLHQ